MNQKNLCPICASTKLEKFLTWKKVPTTLNLIYSEQKSAINSSREDLNLAVCLDCGFIFNQTFDISKMSYGNKYDNAQNFSPYFTNYISNLANFLITEKKVKNCNIVEIGCGKGTFLRKLVEDKTWNNRGYGFDPSYEGPETDLEGRLNFEKRYYDLDCTHIDADIIICRHVIEHVPDPLHLLRIARNALKNSKIGKIFFETPSLEWILRNQVIYDFSYEHCNYFSANSLKTAFEKTGFIVENIKSIFEEQHLWLEAKSSSEKIEVTQNPDPIPNLAKKFGTMEKELTKKWKLKIQELAEKGKVAIWGAGGKGVTFVNLVDPYRKWIDSVIDLNYNKQGNYLPGTGHPIINYKQISSRKIMAAILMNPNYYDETVKMLNKSKINIDLIQ